MPELPEVETIRRDLAGVLVGKKIKDVVVRKAKMARGGSRRLTKALVGQRVASVERRAKLLMLRLEPSNHYLLLHLKMTGQLTYQDANEVIAGGHSWRALEQELPAPSLPDKHTHIIFSFTGGAKLYFNDLRQFGYVQVVSPEEKAVIERTYGIEPLTAAFTLEAFRQALGRRAAPLKAVLLNQAVIAGLGNIYVDEVCFAAGVGPQRRVNRLTHDEVARLWRACTKIIERAIKYRGTTFNTYRDSRGRRGNYLEHLQVYGRMGEPCRRCAGVVKRVTVAGRGTHYCPSCQT